MHNTTEIEKAAMEFWDEDHGNHSLFDAFKAGAEWQKLNSEKQSNFEAFAIESIKENEKTQIGEVEKGIKWANCGHISNPSEKGWYLLRSPDAHPKAVGRSWFDGNIWHWGDTPKRYLQDNKQIQWLDESATDKPETVEAYERYADATTDHLTRTQQERNELQEEVKRLRTALEKISTTQLNSPTEAEGRFYDCIDIAERALSQK